MPGIFRKTIVISLVLVLVYVCSTLCFAGSVGVHEISGIEDMLAIREDPGGSYELTCDIDMSGLDWEPFAFFGTFNGNGFHIFNLSINNFTEETRTVYDCNHKPYDAHFAGLFGIIENAKIENLNIWAENISIDCDDECVFTGLVSGYMYGSYINGVTVRYGKSSLSTAGKCFGSGGIAGYTGEGKISCSSAQVCLVCNDEDLNYKDEQFMGGAYALGYADLDGVSVDIDGYDADHGYVHNGGLIGSYYKYNGETSYGNVSNCSVKGKITFFEDNKNRRAYCKPYIGEIMQWTLDMNNNTQDFTRDEIYDYTAVLGPHRDCENPQIEETVTEPTYSSYGFTLHKCKSCGYCFEDAYKPCKKKVEAVIMSLDLNRKNNNSTIYEGDYGKLNLHFLPEDASPDSFEIISDNSTAVRMIGATEGSELEFTAPGLVTINAVVDGEICESLSLIVKSRGDYIWDTYKTPILGAICGALAFIFGIAALILRKIEKRMLDQIKNSSGM